MATTWTPAAYFRAASRTASSASAAATLDAGKDGVNGDAAASGGGAATAHPASGVDAEAARKRRAAEAAARPTVVEVEMTDAEAAEEPFYALIVLNQPLVEGFRGLWSRGTVDGVTPCKREGGPPDAVRTGGRGRACVCAGQRPFAFVRTAERTSSTTPSRRPSASGTLDLPDSVRFEPLAHPTPCCFSRATHRLLPSFIKGDLDSLREDVARYYRDRVRG